jgi:hypothetical protein
MQVLARGAVVRRIVQRINQDEFAERLLDSFWDTYELTQSQPPRAEVREWVRWNLDVVTRWLVDGRPPSEAEVELFREQARARADAGIPAEALHSNFRRGARFAWATLLEAATDDERPALLESADLLFEYVDRAARIFSEVYDQAARTASATAEELGARALLRRIATEEAPLPEDLQLADRIGFQLDRASRPFVIASPGRPAQHHAGLAAHLRRRRSLAVSEGRRVVGLSNVSSPWQGIELDVHAIVAQAPPSIRGERGRTLEELRMAVDVAVARGHTGEIAIEDYLAELLLRRSPRIAARIRTKVYGPLSEELAHTLDVLIEHSFERGSTAAALPVHRNTLRDRIARISEITGVELDSAEGRGLAWLAWLQGRDSPSRPAGPDENIVP